MSIRSRLLCLVTLPLLVALLAIAGCSGKPAPAEPSIGKVERTETIRALGLALVTRGYGVARMVGTLLNEAQAPDRLVGLDVDTEIGDFDVILAEAPIVLATDEPVRLAREAQVTVIADRLRPGYRVELTLRFRNSPPIATTVPVEPPTGPYAEVEILRPPDGDISP